MKLPHYSQLYLNPYYLVLPRFLHSMVSTKLMLLRNSKLLFKLKRWHPISDVGRRLIRHRSDGEQPALIIIQANWYAWGTLMLAWISTGGRNNGGDSGFAKAQAGAHWLRMANNKATLPRRRLWNTFGVQRNPTRACSYDFLVLKMFNKRSRDKFTIRIPFNILKDIWSAPHPYREVLLYI
jgi:hypothetical protein